MLFRSKVSTEYMILLKPVWMHLRMNGILLHITEVNCMEHIIQVLSVLALAAAIGVCVVVISVMRRVNDVLLDLRSLLTRQHALQTQ